MAGGSAHTCVPLLILSESSVGKMWRDKRILRGHSRGTMVLEYTAGILIAFSSGGQTKISVNTQIISHAVPKFKASVVYLALFE